MENNQPNSKKYLTFVNSLNAARLLLIPPIIWLFYGRKQYIAAIVVIALSGLIEMIISRYARKNNILSCMDKGLYPIADMLTRLAMAACLTDIYHLSWMLLIIIVIKWAVTTIRNIKASTNSEPDKRAKWFDKFSKIGLYFVVIILISAADISGVLANGLIIMVSAALLVSLIMEIIFCCHVADKTSETIKPQKAAGIVCKSVGILIWLIIIITCIVHRNEFSAEGIASYTPGNSLAAAIVMLMLFALKSLSVVIYSGLLYAASGIIFPLPAAIILNIAGTVIMVTLPYEIGKKNGSSAVNAIREKYPKAEAISEKRTKNDFIFAFLARMMRLPSDVVSVYMGAVNVEYKKYLLGSLLGIFPHTIIFPIIGMNVRDVHSPEFFISICAELAYILITALFYMLYRKKSKNKS